MIGPAAAAFVAGFGALAAEILAARQLAPFFGATLESWSFLIGATLLFGGAGALVGGFFRRPFGASSEAVAFAGAATWIACVARWSGAVVGACASIDGRAGLVTAAVATVGPPAFLLGAAAPLLSARIAPGTPSQKTVGVLVGASTLGSLAGALGVALIGAPTFGVRATAYATAAVLLVPVAASIFGRTRRAIVGGGSAVLLVFAATGGAPSTPGRFVRETPYGLLTLERSEAGGAVFVNGVPQARAPLGPIAPGALLADRDGVALLPYLRPTARRAVVVGLGGGLHARALEAHGIEARSIEIDAALVDAVRTFFGYDGAVDVGDGRATLRRAERPFDLVVFDAFIGEATPSHLLTVEALREARDVMTPNGVVLVHLVDRPDGPAVGAVASALAVVFASTRAYRTRIGGDMQDLTLLASDGALSIPPHPDVVAAGWPVEARDAFEPKAGVPAPTDDLDPYETLDAPSARERRRRALATGGR